MSFWTKSLTSPRTDEKVREVGLFVLLGGASVASLVVWTYIVRELHDFGYAMAGWSVESRKQGPWEPFIVLWFMPLLIGTLLSLMIYASKAKKKRL